MLFSEKGSSHSVKQRIPPQPAEVRSSLSSVAWRQFLVVPRIIPVDDLKVASDAATAVVPLVLGPTSRASGSLALGLFLNI